MEGTWGKPRDEGDVKKKAVNKVINLLPLKADSSFASYEIPHILWNPTVNYRMYNSQPMLPVPTQMTSVHGLLFL